MKKIFKQLFCKHEWETSSNSLSIEDFYTHKNTVVSEIHKVCKKCGKQIVMAIALFLVCTMSGCTWYESFSGCGIIEYHSCGYDSNYNFWYYVTIKDDYGNIRKIRVDEYTWYTTNVGDYVCFD